jgi:nucleoside-diphosphate-sugar epimerase
MIPHIVGASGRSGAALCRRLAEAGDSFIPVVRNPARWAVTGLPGTPRIADLADRFALQAALGDAVAVVSCAHARHAGAVLAASPRAGKFVFLGSTRKFTRWPDAHGAGVLAGEAAFLASGRPGVMLHPTMIYGAQGEDNVRRLATLLRRLPLVPLPAGGRALVQPIYQDDVTDCLLAALHASWTGPQTRIIAGPYPCTYADFVRAAATAAGLKPPRILAVPLWLLLAAAPLTRLPGLPRIRGDEIRRLAEDKGFDSDVLALTGRPARSLAEGLGRTFSLR